MLEAQRLGLPPWLKIEYLIQERLGFEDSDSSYCRSARTETRFAGMSQLPAMYTVYQYTVEGLEDKVENMAHVRLAANQCTVLEPDDKGGGIEKLTMQQSDSQSEIVSSTKTSSCRSYAMDWGRSIDVAVQSSFF